MLGFFKHNTRATRIAAPLGAVRRSTATLMQQRGWTKTWNGAWTGPYATRYGTWAGKIENAGGGTLRVFIHNPPVTMASHPKWPCFHMHDGSGWYRIHLRINPVDRDPNSVVRYVEQILTEVHKR